MTDRDFLFGYFFARRSAKPWKPGPRKHPKMPSTSWRLAALACTAIGAALFWLLFRGGDSRALMLRIGAGGVVGLVVGMYLVETVWEHRRRRAPGRSTGITDRTSSMNLEFEGKWRWAIAVAVFVGMGVGMFLPSDWNLLIRSTIVGAVAAVCMFAAAAIRAATGGEG